MWYVPKPTCEFTLQTNACTRFLLHYQFLVRLAMEPKGMQNGVVDGSNDLGVSNCYVFKSRLQEYAQKVGLQTPVYETIREGPSHEPSFRSTVIVNDVRYDSLLGFSNRKAAEQSAAEVALFELSKCGGRSGSISQPVHETGLCKNLLQEYAQKMNYAIPLYRCQKDETPGRAAHFSCTVEIGGISYIGASAKTKKEAEISAARTALLAIQSSASQVTNQDSHSHLTVIPCKKRAANPVVKSEEIGMTQKPKKERFKKRVRPMKKKRHGNKLGNSCMEGMSKVNKTNERDLESHQNGLVGQDVKSFENGEPSSPDSNASLHVPVFSYGDAKALSSA